jgi:uncharacterized protein HemY
VIYQHHGNPDAAEQALRYALSQAPNNTISNLAQTLEAENKLDEAAALRRAGAAGTDPPFYFFHQARKP